MTLIIQTKGVFGMNLAKVTDWKQIRDGKGNR